MIEHPLGGAVVVHAVEVSSAVSAGALSIATSSAGASTTTPPSTSAGQSAGSQFHRKVLPQASGPDAHLPAPSPKEHHPHPRTGVHVPQVVNDEQPGAVCVVERW